MSKVKEKKKKNYLVIVLVVLLLALAIGYAAFSATLTVNGTAKGEASWSVIYTNAKLVDVNNVVDNSHGNQPIISEDGLSVTVNVKLGYPGDAVKLQTTIANIGSLPAKLTGYNITGWTANDEEDLEITEATASKGEIIKPNGVCNSEFIIKWKKDSTAKTIDKTFTITYTYEQNTDEVNMNATHTDA